MMERMGIIMMVVRTTVSLLVIAILTVMIIRCVLKISVIWKARHVKIF